MILKINQTASEHEKTRVSQVYAKKEVCSLLKYKITALYKGLIIPDNLIAEAENFMNRNFIEEANYESCPRCLKAHVLKTADDLELAEKEKEFLDLIFPGEAGHNGYYLDEENVVLI